MTRRIRFCLILAVFFTGPAYANEACLGCHLDSEGSPIHAMLNTKHGGIYQSCEACHGSSEDHMATPTMASPDVSFGPRWTASPALQDGQCLECHQYTVASHWNDALHMAKNVTCVSCHDLHVENDTALQGRAGQMDVCTTCHKTQKSGIHGREKMVRMNPPCTDCHNPHADQRPKGTMLANDSQGCRRCHNMQAMAKSDSVSERAKSYHKIMESGDKTCIGCHVGVAHGDPDASELFMPLPQSQRQLTLFSPGTSDADWLLTAHPGSQPLRQGTNCRQCHRGEEAQLGAAMGGPEPTDRAVDVHFSQGEGQLVTTLSWQGTEDEAKISLMWGFGDNAALQRGGCWAACHGDMPGMTLDKGKGVDKYLWASLSQRRTIGQPAITLPEADLQKQLNAGNFAELWSVDLQKNALTVSTLLAGISPLDDTGVTANAAFKDGVWTVEIHRPSSPPAPLLALAPGRAYTFGLALNSKERRGSKHWVSLPMTLSVDNEDTDFITD
jgi:predicted CXXCH cytochrome family protein